MESVASENAVRTRRCLESIQSRNETRAKAILLLGKAGVGKSSLAEYVAGVTGLSGATPESGMFWDVNVMACF
jgi:ATP-dependent protease HslVU (ClpYQ) ATPase subunit